MSGKGAGRVGNRRMSRDHPNYSNIKIGQFAQLAEAGEYTDCFSAEG